MNQNKIVVFTGAGVSAESGIRTFRGSDGLWNHYAIEELATPEAFQRHPERVLDFYNERRQRLGEVEPNAAHRAIAELQSCYEVMVITQNVDNLHERAGSKQVIHVHGEITRARSSLDSRLVYDIGYAPIRLGQCCDKGSQLRPHVVWFGESVLNYELASRHFQEASRILVVGTSLVVFPVANLLCDAPIEAEKVIVSLEVERVPADYRLIQAKATEQVPVLVKGWLKDLC